MENLVARGDRILEIGCGTGALAIRCAERGAMVICIDPSPKTIAAAKRRTIRSDAAGRIDLRRMDPVDMGKEFRTRSFTKIISTFTMSGFTEGERDFVLKQCRRVLKPNGRMIVVDRVVPKSLWRRLLLKIVRMPLEIVAYLLTQTSIGIARDLEEKLANARFLVIEVKDLLLGGIRIYVAERVGR